MFFIFSKDKIVSYVLSFFMVMILLGIAFITKDSKNSRAAMSNNIEQKYYNEK